MTTKRHHSGLLSPSLFGLRSSDRFDRFYVHCLSTQKTLDEKKYETVEEIKQDIFKLFEQGDFNDYNAVITYMNDENEEVPLSKILPPLPKGQYRDLFIRLIHSACAMCESSFGVLDGQLLFECPTNKCGEQYCKKCVTSIQGPTGQHPFMCILCRKEVQPKHNILIEKYLIWPRIGHLYGAENLLELEGKTGSLSIDSIKKDIQFRCIHLKSRLDAYQRKATILPNLDEKHEQLVADVEEMCRQCENIFKQIEDIDGSMRTQFIDLEQIVTRHENISKGFDALLNELRHHVPDSDTSELDQSYLSSKLETLSTDCNVNSIDQSMRDLNARKQLLDHYICSLQLSMSNSNEQHVDQDLIGRSTDVLKKLDELLDELSCLRGPLRAVERRLHEYFHALSDHRQPDIRGARFIYLLELLRRQTEQIELQQNFPRSIRLMNEWRHDYGQEDNFKPKVLDLCKTIEEDCKDILSEKKSTYSIPYKVGVLGLTSVGKSALIIQLGNFEQYGSMINLERSTFSYLQFDTVISNSSSEGKDIPLSFIDIAGATDDVNAKSVGTYLELISNADCDLYLIVFDRPFNAQNQAWLEYIEKTLNRKCLLVRSKVDMIFHNFYTSMANKRFRRDMYDLYSVRHALVQTQKYAKTTYDEQQLEQEIFLTATGNDDDLNEVEFGRFDFNRLRKRIYKLATNDSRVVRLCNLATLAARTTINTCFRRGYTVAKTKYRWLAAGASIIPFLDEVPAFFGREEIRQAFGIHDRSSIANRFRGTKNSLEEYLIVHNFKVPKDSIKSGYFQYLVSEDLPTVDTEKLQLIERNRLSEQVASSAHAPGLSAVGSSVGAVGALGQIFQNVLRVAAPAASGVLRVVSVAGIVVGAVLTPIAAAWSFYSSGKRMNRHVHLLCDDLQVVLTYFIIRICHGVVENEPTTVSSSSSSDDDSSFEDVSDD